MVDTAMNKLARALRRHKDRQSGRHRALPPAMASEDGFGKVSVEHVVNVLGRLNAVPMPQTAATQLKVSTPPLANTARYDSLRADNATEEAGHDA